MGLRVLGVHKRGLGFLGFLGFVKGGLVFRAWGVGLGFVGFRGFRGFIGFVGFGGFRGFIGGRGFRAHCRRLNNFQCFLRTTHIHMNSKLPKIPILFE